MFEVLIFYEDPSIWQSNILMIRLDYKEKIIIIIIIIFNYEYFMSFIIKNNFINVIYII